MSVEAVGLGRRAGGTLSARGVPSRTARRDLCRARGDRLPPGPAGRHQRVPQGPPFVDRRLRRPPRASPGRGAVLPAHDRDLSHLRGRHPGAGLLRLRAPAASPGALRRHAGRAAKLARRASQQGRRASSPATWSRSARPATGTTSTTCCPSVGWVARARPARRPTRDRGAQGDSADLRRQARRQQRQVRREEGRRRRRSRRSFLWRHRRASYLVVLVLLATTTGAGAVLSRIPLPEDDAPPQTSYLCAADVAEECGPDNALASFAAEQDRYLVDFDDVPQRAGRRGGGGRGPRLLQPLRARPDRRGPGALQDVRGGAVLQGGSTITQQYVKNAYLTHERSLVRKLREAVLAVKLERQLTKEEILERYLNTIYFGRGAYGVAAAARAYFGHDLTQMELHEAAYLAALIRAPETADVFYGADRAEASFRLKSVLDAMVDEDMVGARGGGGGRRRALRAVRRRSSGPDRTGPGAQRRRVRHPVLRRPRAPDAHGRPPLRGGHLHQGPAHLHQPRPGSAMPRLAHPVRGHAGGSGQRPGRLAGVGRSAGPGGGHGRRS